MFRKKTWKTIFFSLAAIVLFFAFAEWLFRTMEQDAQPELPPSPMEMQHLPKDGIIARPAGSNHMTIMMNFSDRFSVLPHPKPGNTFRVYIFGGSASAGLGFPRNGHFGRWLERMLELSCPDRDIEVVKLASVGFSSVQVRELVDEVLEEGEPDLLVVYSGNNEYLDVKAHKALAQAMPLHARRLNRGLSKRSATVRFLRDRLPRKESTPAEPERLDSEIQQILGSYIGIWIDDDENRDVLDRYRRNLTEIAQKAEQAGVPVVLCTLIANPMHDLEAHFINKFQIGDESLLELFPQAYGWARLNRWDKAAPLLGQLSHLGPSLDLFRMYEAGGIRGIPRLSEESRQWLNAKARNIIDRFGQAESLDEETRFALAICHHLLGQEDRVKSLMDGNVDFSSPDADSEVLMKRAYWAQFLGEEEWKKAYYDLWQNGCRGNIACPKTNAVVRAVAPKSKAILVDVEKELEDWLDPGPLHYLSDYCHFNIEGAFEVANLVFRKALSAGALPPEAKAVDFRATLLAPDLETLRQTGHDFLERDKWMGFDFRVCFAYCKPPADYSRFDLWAREDGAAYPVKEIVRTFSKHRRWFEQH